MRHVLEGPAKWACAFSTPSRVAMRPVSWMLPGCGRGSKAMSPASRPRVSGCRASWSRPCRCRQAPVHTGPLQLRRKSTRSPRPRTRSLAERPFCMCSRGRRAAQAQRERPAQQQQQQHVDVAQREEHRSPPPAAGGSTPSVHANRGRSHGHRTRDLAERPASNLAPGSRSLGRGNTNPDSDPSEWGVRANSIVDSIRQEPDPHCGSGFLSPQRPTAETSGMPALRHMRRLGNGWPAWL